MKSCVIFGAGIYGKQAHEYLKDRYEIVAYIDNDERKHLSRLCGLEIFPPAELNRFAGCDVLIAARFPYPIVAQLRTMGIANPVYIFDPRSKEEGRYLLYRVENGDICVPEYMDSRYTVDESLRCHYSDLPKNTLRLFQTAAEWIKSDFPPKTKIIELGCGSGQFANMLFDEGYTNYVGFDFSAVAVARAAELNPTRKGCFAQRDIRGMEWPPDVELIVIFEVLEHLADDIAVIRELPKETTVTFTVPNFDSFNHVRKFDGLAAIVERYGRYFDFSRYQRIDARNHKCWHLLQGRKI